MSKSNTKELKEVLDGYDRIESKMDDFAEWLKQKDKEFKLMELEDKAFELNPQLKKISH